MLFYVRYTTQKSGDVKILTFQDTMKIPLQLRVHFINSTFQKIIASYQLRSYPATKSANFKGIVSSQAVSSTTTSILPKMISWWWISWNYFYLFFWSRLPLLIVPLSIKESFCQELIIDVLEDHLLDNFMDSGYVFLLPYFLDLGSRHLYLLASWKVCPINRLAAVFPGTTCLVSLIV